MGSKSYQDLLVWRKGIEQVGFVINDLIDGQPIEVSKVELTFELSSESAFMVGGVTTQIEKVGSPTQSQDGGEEFGQELMLGFGNERHLV